MTDLMYGGGEEDWRSVQGHIAHESLRGSGKRDSTLRRTLF